MASAVLTGFTSCSDDDDAPAPVQKEELTFSTDNLRVKIGEENRQALPIATGGGQYNAYSLDPDVADIWMSEDGQAYVEGFRNGTAQIVVSDAENQYKRLTVGVYTTDEMTLSHDTYEFLTPLGLSSTSSECHVLLGNGGYTAESSNPKVKATVDSETGVITLTATSGKNEFIADVTVSDCTGLSAVIKVKVNYTLDAFTDADIAELAAKSANETYIKSSLFPETCNTDCNNWGWSYGQWKDADNDDGSHTFGWWEPSYGDYGGHYIIYPAGTALNTEVAATYKFQYSVRTTTWTMEGKAKIIRDDSVAKVMIWWDVDLDNECINRGWIVWKK